MKISYMSDIHLEFHRDGGQAMVDEVIANTPEVDLVVLAGDIGVLNVNSKQILRLLDGLSEKATKVFYIPGNHCFYGDRYKAGLGRLESLAHSVPENVVVGYACYTDFQLDGYTICGGTLWFPDLYPPQHVKACLNDFTQILDLEPQIYRENTFFTAQLRKLNTDKLIVVTHHAPSYRSIHPRFAGSSVNQFFCNDLDGLIEAIEPKLWISGHLHDPVDYFIGNTRLVSAPCGYPFEMNINWKPKVIEI